MPALAARLCDPARADRRWAAAARRVRAGQRLALDFFHRTDDPQAALVARLLPALRRAFDVDIRVHLVGPARPELLGDPERHRTWAARDAAEWAERLGLAPHGPECRDPEAADGAIAAARDPVEEAAARSAAAWRGEPCAARPPPEPVRRAGDRALRRAGHYQPGVIVAAGLPYAGVTRLPRLEARLAGVGLGTGAPSPSAWRGPAPPCAEQGPVELWASLRSPYTWIGLDRVVRAAREAGRPLRLRPVLPMVARGLPVPRAKRSFILRDAALEARRHGVPFGRICDPLGPGVERGLAVLQRAAALGRDIPFLRSALAGAWSEGIDLASRRGLEHVAARAGLGVAEVRAALADANWRSAVERNRRDLLEAGLWGVPSFRVGTWSAWGQDRVPLLRARLGLDPVEPAP